MTAGVSKWRLEELTLHDVRELNWQVIVLPLGATEPHNLHLPYGTDSIEAGQLADRCAARAWQMGGRVGVLPTLPFGTESNLSQFPLAIDIRPTTLFAVLGDVVRTVEKSGINKLLLFNSHGGNDLKPFLREIYGQTSVHVFLCNWYHMVRDRAQEICQHQDDHAGEMETSLILRYAPQLVRRDSAGKLAADEGKTRPLRFEALREGWVALSRPWHLLTTNSGSGYPHSADAEKGVLLEQVVVDRVGPFLAELSKADVAEPFPFVEFSD
ncbi:MAG: creatininase family protein [Planctomycetales bacterium]|nr:creatininase family protein [Planctomycetales bacterium]